jgi:hypothetical protein
MGHGRLQERRRQALPGWERTTRIAMGDGKKQRGKPCIPDQYEHTKPDENGYEDAFQQAGRANS